MLRTFDPWYAAINPAGAKYPSSVPKEVIVITVCDVVVEGCIFAVHDCTMLMISCIVLSSVTEPLGIALLISLRFINRISFTPSWFRAFCVSVGTESSVTYKSGAWICEARTAPFADDKPAFILCGLCFRTSADI